MQARVSLRSTTGVLRAMGGRAARAALGGLLKGLDVVVHAHGGQ